MLHRDNIVVRQRGLGFWRRLGIEGALDGGLTQSGFVCDLASNPFGRSGGFTIADFQWFILRHWNFGPRFQQVRIAPDMFVPLLFGEVEPLQVFRKLSARRRYY